MDEISSAVRLSVGITLAVLMVAAACWLGWWSVGAPHREYVSRVVAAA